jgi:hypothetical protein
MTDTTNITPRPGSLKAARILGEHCGYCRADIVKLSAWLLTEGATEEGWHWYLTGFEAGEARALRPNLGNGSLPQPRSFGTLLALGRDENFPESDYEDEPNPGEAGPGYLYGYSRDDGTSIGPTIVGFESAEAAWDTAKRYASRYFQANPEGNDRYEFAIWRKSGGHDWEIVGYLTCHPFHASMYHCS